MADRITLNFGANTREVERGADRMSDSLKDTEEALEDVGKTGQEVGDEAASGLSKAGDAVDDVGGKLDELGGVANDVLEGDFANAAESGVRSLSRLADFIPGAGAAIGAALATIAGNFIKSWDDAAKENEERINSMYDNFIESGRDFNSAEQVNAAVRDLIKDQDKLNRIKEEAATAGVRLSVALRAEAGDTTALSTVLQAVRDRRAELNAQQDDYIAKNGDVNAQLDYQIGTLDLLERSYEDLAGQTDSAIAMAQLYRDATEDAGTATGNLADELNNVPSSVYAGVEVDTATAEAQLKSFLTKRRGLDIDVRYRAGRAVD